MSYLSYIIKNWTDADELELSAWAPNGQVPANVTLIARNGSMYFQHGLSPAQCREMAAKLLELADVAETLQIEHDAADVAG